jgi:hypothetical protein
MELTGRLLQDLDKHMKKLLALASLSILLLYGLVTPTKASFVMSTTNAVTGDVYANAYWVPIIIDCDWTSGTAHIVMGAYEDQAHYNNFPGSYFAVHTYDLNSTSQQTFATWFGTGSPTTAVRIKTEQIVLLWLDTEPNGHTVGDSTPQISFFANATHNVGTF